MEEINTIGTLLRTAREKKKISIEEIARQTKININVLRSLEKDDIKNLPNKTYVKGFVNNYAKAVSVDINDARSALENTYDIKLGGNVTSTQPEKKLGALQADNPEEAETQEIKETLNSIVQSMLNKKVIYAIAVVIVVSLVLKGVVSFFSNLNFETKKIADKPTESKEVNEADIKPASENLFDIKATKKIAQIQVAESKIKKTEVKATEKKVESKKEVVTKQEVTKKEEPKKEAVAKKEEKKPEPKKKEKPKLVDGKFPFKKFRTAPTNLYTLSSDADEVSNLELLPANIKAAKVEGKQNVYVVASDADTWISYKKDDEKIKRYVLKKGRSVLIKGDRVLLFMGNFNATKVFLNNQLVVAETRTGVKSLIFPQEVGNEYELPLFPSFNGVPYSSAEYKANMQEETPEATQ